MAWLFPPARRLPTSCGQRAPNPTCGGTATPVSWQGQGQIYAKHSGLGKMAPSAALDGIVTHPSLHVR